MRLRLLFVDDDPDIRAIATMALALDPALEVRAAGSADEALALIQGPPGFRPDGVLLDVMMPGMPGTELAQRIRAMPGLGTVPFLFMTASARDTEIARYLALGAECVIAKPFDPLCLAAEVRAKLEARLRA